MGANVHLEICRLFRSKWVPTILEVLAEQPHRFRPLAARVQARVEGHLDDSTLTRCLERMQDARHVQATHTYAGSRPIPTYQLTADGLVVLNFYQEVLAAYEQVRSASGSGARADANGHHLVDTLGAAAPQVAHDVGVSSRPGVGRGEVLDSAGGSLDDDGVP